MSKQNYLKYYTKFMRRVNRPKDAHMYITVDKDDIASVSILWDGFIYEFSCECGEANVPELEKTFPTLHRESFSGWLDFYSEGNFNSYKHE